MKHRPSFRIWIEATALAASLLSIASARAQPPSNPSVPAPRMTLLSAPTRPLKFDIATFKLNNSSGPIPYIKIPVGGDGFSMENRPLHDLIRFAFAKGRGGTYRMSGQPSWIDDDHYDVQAKIAEEDLPEWQKLDAAGQKIVLQQFLIENLKLKFHPDPTKYPFYALTVGKSGPKIKEAHEGDTFTDPKGQPVAPRTLLWPNGNEVIAYDSSMERFADMLSAHADRAVLDRTGLDGSYNFDLKFDPGAPEPNMPEGRPFFNLSPDAATPAIFSAVKQIGMQLVPAKGPMDGIVIEHIERPPQN